MSINYPISIFVIKYFDIFRQSLHKSRGGSCAPSPIYARKCRQAPYGNSPDSAGSEFFRLRPLTLFASAVLPILTILDWRGGTLRPLTLFASAVLPILTIPDWRGGTLRPLTLFASAVLPILTIPDWRGGTLRPLTLFASPSFAICVARTSLLKTATMLFSSQAALAGSSPSVLEHKRKKR